MMPLTVEQTVAPTEEPVSLLAVKSHLRIDSSDDDVLIAGFIAAARRDVETYTRRQLMPATWRLYLDTFPTEIRLPYPPTSSVTSIQYLDSDNVLQTLATSVYQTDLVSEPARIAVTLGQAWPSTYSGAYNAVRVTYVAGYATAQAVPVPLRLAVQMLVGDYYEHREARLDLNGSVRAITENPTLDRLLWRYRILEL